VQLGVRVYKRASDQCVLLKEKVGGELGMYHFKSTFGCSLLNID